MPKIPRITANQIMKVVEKLGFCLSRQSGSHKIFINQDGVRITIPVHSGKILHPKIVKSIMIDANINYEMLKNML